MTKQMFPLQGNMADAMSLDAADIYTAATFYGLTIVAKEIYQDGELSFTECIMCRASHSPHTKAHCYGNLLLLLLPLKQVLWKVLGFYFC